MKTVSFEPERPDLDTFREMNNRSARVPWWERMDAIRKQFPSVVDLDWTDALSDVDLFGRIMRDILKYDQADPGKSGPRFGVTPDKGMAAFRRLMGEDYSTLSFSEALRVLAGPMSLTTLARKTGLSRTKLHRLLRAEEDPRAAEMKAVARAFGKDPSYFAEYRATAVMAFVGARLSQAPEASIAVYRKIKAQ